MGKKKAVNNKGVNNKVVKEKSGTKGILTVVPCVTNGEYYNVIFAPVYREKPVSEYRRELNKVSLNIMQYCSNIPLVRMQAGVQLYTNLKNFILDAGVLFKYWTPGESAEDDADMHKLYDVVQRYCMLFGRALGGYAQLGLIYEGDKITNVWAQIGLLYNEMQSYYVVKSKRDRADIELSDADIQDYESYIKDIEAELKELVCITEEEKDLWLNFLEYAGTVVNKADKVAQHYKIYEGYCKYIDKWAGIRKYLDIFVYNLEQSSEKKGDTKEERDELFNIIYNFLKNEGRDSIAHITAGDKEFVRQEFYRALLGHRGYLYNLDDKKAAYAMADIGMLFGKAVLSKQASEEYYKEWGIFNLDYKAKLSAIQTTRVVELMNDIVGIDGTEDEATLYDKFVSHADKQAREKEGLSLEEAPVEYEEYVVDIISDLCVLYDKSIEGDIACDVMAQQIYDDRVKAVKSK